MADDRNKQGPADRSRINVNEDYEVRYWTQVLGVSANRLREVVSQVGPTVEAVKRKLQSN